MNPLEVVGAVIGILAGFTGIGAVVFSAGRFTESVKANTAATNKLSDVIDTHLTWSAEMAREVDNRFNDHDTRIALHDTRIAMIEAKGLRR